MIYSVFEIKPKNWQKITTVYFQFFFVRLKKKGIYLRAFWDKKSVNSW
jgi:hypothetical protein